MQSRALVITNIPTPYRLPLFNELRRQLEAQGIALKVVFAATGYAKRRWHIDFDSCAFDYEVLQSRSVVVPGAESASFDYPGLGALLRRERPDAIVIIGYSPGTVKLWLRSFFRNTPYIIWSGAIASSHEPVSALRTLLRRLLVSRARAFVAYGSRAADYLASLGAPRKRIFIAINTVDTEFFAREASARRQGRPGPEFLYVGHLTAGKRIGDVIRAFARVLPRFPDARLTLVGDGPERSALEGLCAEMGVAGRVAFEGFRQRPEVPGYLARARVFLFPSVYDVWGLVLVEAMAAGVPCIASPHSGATADLVQDGVTGYVVDFTDQDRVVEAMLEFLEQPERAARMGEAAATHIRDKVNLRVSAAGMVQAIEEATIQARD